MTAVLEVSDLVVRFKVGDAYITPVNGVSLRLRPGETLGLVGESGCGKSTLARAVLQLIRPDSGRVLLGDKDLTRLRGSALRSLRTRLQMVFQDPRGSLDPRKSVLSLISEPLKVHRLADRGERKRRAHQIMERVGLDAAYAQRRPSELSGGQQQRVGIARALITDPAVVICDEPVSALDVSIQAQVINLIRDLQSDLDTAFLFIAHDLAVVRRLSRRVAVMYLGRVVEQGPRDQIFGQPAHPYTKGLVASIVRADVNARHKLAEARRLVSGDLPSLLDPPPGCAYNTRCPYAVEICREAAPSLDTVVGHGHVACHRWREIRDQPPVLNRPRNPGGPTET